MGRVIVLAWWAWHLSHSMEVGIKIAVATELLGRTDGC